MHPEDLSYMPEGMGDLHGEFFTRLYPMEAMNSMLSSCDFVVVALPLTEETHHILGAPAFEAMKETAYLVNVGRGALVDEAALTEALKLAKSPVRCWMSLSKNPCPQIVPCGIWKMCSSATCFRI